LGSCLDKEEFRRQSVGSSSVSQEGMFQGSWSRSSCQMLRALSLFQTVELARACYCVCDSELVAHDHWGNRNF
jgi:hypothetical protein